MARKKRTPSASQRDKIKIAAAKYLKAQGLLSKTTKLHGGRFISRRVLKKTAELEWIAQNRYKAVKVKHSYIEEAQKHGMLTARHGRTEFAIVPNNSAEIRRVKRGVVSGIVPVPGGQLYTVALPYPTLSDFVRAVDNGEIDNFKEPQEHFAFTYFGHMSSQRRGFRNYKELREWLRRYDFVDWIGDASMNDAMEKAYAHFTLYRMLPGAWNPQDYTTRDVMRRENRKARQMQQDRRVEGRRNKRIGEISATAAERRRAADRDRKARSYQQMKESNPDAYRAQIEAAKERVRKSRARKKRDQ